MAKVHAPACFVLLPSELQRDIATLLTDDDDRHALLCTCTAGRDAMLRGAPQVSLIFPLALPRAVLKSRTSSLIRVSSCRPTEPLRVRLELTGDDYKRFSDRASWLLGLCVAEAGANCTWDVTLQGLLLGSQLVPDYLASACPTLASLQLAGCYVSHTAPRVRRGRQPGAMQHAALQRLTVNGGSKPAHTMPADGMSSELLTDMLRHQLPSLPALHSVVIKVHSLADCVSIPQAGVMGPQLHSLHVVHSAPGLTAWQHSLHAYAPSLTHLTHLQLTSPDRLRHANMQLLLQLPTVTHLTIPHFALWEEVGESLAHLPCTWQHLCVDLPSSVLVPQFFQCLPLATLQKPVQLNCKSGHVGLAALAMLGPTSTAMAEVKALTAHMQHCGGFSWPGLQILAVAGDETARHLNTDWLLAAMPLLPRELTQVRFSQAELTQPLLDEVGRRWGVCASLLALVDCHLHAEVCGQLLARMPRLSQVMIAFTLDDPSVTAEARAADMQRLHDSVVEVCRTTTRPIRVQLLMEEQSKRRLQVAVQAVGTRGMVQVMGSADDAIPGVVIRVV